jgi:hypothetical protein
MHSVLGGALSILTKHFVGSDMAWQLLLVTKACSSDELNQCTAHSCQLKRALQHITGSSYRWKAGVVVNDQGFVFQPCPLVPNSSIYIFATSDTMLLTVDNNQGDGAE